MNDTAIAEREVVEELVETVPITIAGVFREAAMSRTSSELPLPKCNTRKRLD